MNSPRETPEAVPSGSWTAVVAVLLACSAATVAGPAAAIDQVAILSPDRSTVEAAPGETVAVDVTLRSQGGHGGEGVESVTLIARYHPDYLEITDVERGPWLEGDDVEVRSADAVAHDAGTAALEQRRDPPAGGTNGSETIATLTVRVADDAPAGTTTISFDESEVGLTGDWPMAVVDESATVAIAGGDEPLEPFDHPDPDALDLDLEPAAAATDADGESSGNGGEPTAGFTAGLALAAVVLAVTALVTRS
jgi:hypothetical protein